MYLKEENVTEIESKKTISRSKANKVWLRHMVKENEKYPEVSGRSTLPPKTLEKARQL